MKVGRYHELSFEPVTFHCGKDCGRNWGRNWGEKMGSFKVPTNIVTDIC